LLLEVSPEDLLAKEQRYSSKAVFKGLAGKGGLLWYLDGVKIARWLIRQAQR
jgi:hypothetical protein